MRQIALVLTLIMGGCASTGEATDNKAEPEQAPLTVEEILANTLADYPETEPERCLSRSRYSGVEVLDDRHILFRGVSRYWLNELRQKCIGLRRNDPIQIDMQGERACDLDTVRVLYPTGSGFERGASCSLGKFQPLTKEQVQVIKQDLKR